MKFARRHAAACVLAAPAGAQSHRRALPAAVTKLLDAPGAKEKIALVGCEPFKITARQFAEPIKDDLPQWAKIV